MNKLVLLSGIALALCSLTVAPSKAQSVQISGLYNTGVNDDRTLRDEGLTDLHYQLFQNNDTIATQPSVSVNSGNYPWQNNGSWDNNLSESRWISPLPDPSATSDFSTWTYKTHFDLGDNVDFTTAKIIGQAQFDDYSTIWLNGVQKWGPGGNWYSTNNFTLSDGFVHGDNLLEFRVVNSGQGATGMNVTMDGTAQLTNPIPEPGYISVAMFLCSGGLMALRLRGRRSSSK